MFFLIIIIFLLLEERCCLILMCLKHHTRQLTFHYWLRFAAYSFMHDTNPFLSLATFVLCILLETLCCHLINWPFISTQIWVLRRALVWMVWMRHRSQRHSKTLSELGKPLSVDIATLWSIWDEINVLEKSWYDQFALLFSNHFDVLCMVVQYLDYCLH